MILKLLQWNFSTKEKFENIIDELKKHGPDFVCAQEITQKDLSQPAEIIPLIKNRFNYFCYFEKAESWTKRKDYLAQGNAVFSKFPIIGTFCNELSPQITDPENAFFEGRNYIETACAINNKKLVIGATHFPLSKKFVFNETQEKALVKLLNSIKTKKNSYLLAGDLNAPPDSPVIAKIQEILQNAGPDCKQPTWPTKPFSYGPFNETSLKYRIDYVFKTPDIKVIEAKIIKTPYSDHLPILIRFEV